MQYGTVSGILNDMRTDAETRYDQSPKGKAARRLYRTEHAEQGREYTRKWRSANAEAVNAARRAVRHAHKVAMDAVKLATGCVDCGSVPANLSRLHFHHVDPSSKSFGIATAAERRPEDLASELAKCVVLCVSCHALRHRALDRAAAA